jgi:deoxyribonuclease V
MSAHAENKGPLKFPVYMGDERVAMGIRKTPGPCPIFISPGHKVSLDQSVETVTMVTGGPRLPEPLRRAHIFASTRVREHKGEKGV